jgi:hypothetical protein
VHYCFGGRSDVIMVTGLFLLVAQKTNQAAFRHKTYKRNCGLELEETSFNSSQYRCIMAKLDFVIKAETLNIILSNKMF